VIDDVRGVTIASASTLSPEFREMEPPKGKVEAAERVGKMVAGEAIKQGVDKVLFCRNGYIYHGRVRALADAAREGGLIF
jgi:large subunit ribosomal protein L18